jgi:hypothetical protein
MWMKGDIRRCLEDFSIVRKRKRIVRKIEKDLSNLSIIYKEIVINSEIYI